MLLILLSACRLQAQEKDRTINAGSVLKTEQKLASDDMRGRATFTPDIERAADYIESRFKKAGLKPDLTYTQAWDPTMLLIDALRHVGTNGSAQQVRDWILSQQSWAGISGIYDFKDGSQRGVGQRALIMLRWDKDKDTFTAVSRPAGYLK